MRTLVLDPPPPQMEALIAQRQRSGTDLHDEVWEGVYHMIPVAGIAHSLIAAQLAALLGKAARANGLVVGAEFNLGSKDDYRVPDLGVHRDPALAVWTPTAAIAVEVLSPDDDTWKKLPFYAQHEVDEMLIVDLAERSVTWLALNDGEYRPIDCSEILDLGADTLAGRLDWPNG
ncbi:MAG TPA: Uma2 family endonuclease [Solirubrobacteraceae bacterium]